MAEIFRNSVVVVILVEGGWGERGKGLSMNVHGFCWTIHHPKMRVEKFSFNQSEE